MYGSVPVPTVIAAGIPTGAAIGSASFGVTSMLWVLLLVVTIITVTLTVRRLIPKHLA